MFQVLFASIREKVSLSEKEEEMVATFFTPKKLRKRNYLLNAGDVCKYSAFVSKGLLRSGIVDEKDNEHILQFAIEGWWISDIYSFLTSEPSSYFIDSLEESDLLLLTKENNELLLEKVPKMERYFRILTQNAIVAMQRRLIGSLSQSAEEKYLKLLSLYPEIVQRVQQHMIASYIGVTPETLSRIRKQMSLRK